MPHCVLTAPAALRIERSHCTYRNWDHGNKSGWIGYNAYAVESILIDLFSTSEHRREMGSIRMGSECTVCGNFHECHVHMAEGISFKNSTTDTVKPNIAASRYT